MISEIWKFIKGIKDWLDLFIKIVAVVGILSGVLGIRGCKKQVKEKLDTINILTSKVETFKTKAGLNATEADNWKIKYNALDNVNGEISHENTQIKNELIEAKETIKDAELKEKRVNDYIKTNLIAKDSIRTDIIFLDCDNIEIKPIKKKFIELDFIQEGKFLDITYRYNTSIKTLVYLEKDKDQFFLWRWIKPKWLEKTKTIVSDPNAKIDNLVEINFTK